MAVDKRRRELALPSLRVFVIDVISATGERVEVSEGDVEGLRRVKMSSTFVRGWIVERQERERERRRVRELQ